MEMIKRQNEKKKNPMSINNGSNDDTIDVTNKVKANGVPEIYFKISDIYLTWNIFSLTVLITYTTVVAIAFFFFFIRIRGRSYTRLFLRIVLAFSILLFSLGLFPVHQTNARKKQKQKKTKKN